MKILVLGGYGNFARRLVTSLLKYHNHEIIIAGRSKQKGLDFQQYALKHLAKSFSFRLLDIFAVDLTTVFDELKPDVVVNAIGPYQLQSGKQNYTVARACITCRCHYIDLADDRRFVSEFAGELDDQARKADVMLVSGASSVPGLSTAVIDHYRPQFSAIDSIAYGISPGNQTERGLATVASILSYTGHPFTTLINGSQKSLYGWQGLSRYNFGKPLGKRWMSHCNIPDLSVLPKHYSTLKSVRFQAGLEVAPLHIGLWCLSWLSRAGLVKNWARYSRGIIALSEWFINWGSDKGGMYIELSGKDLNHLPRKIIWQLIAENGTGINVPTISAELIINVIRNKETTSGAMPCVGLFKLEDFFKVASRWGIRQTSTLL